MTVNIFRSQNEDWKKRNKKPSRDYKKVYYIFTEGTTELIYFRGIRDSSKAIGISDEIRINPVEKKDKYTNESDANRLKDAIVEFQKENEEMIDSEEKFNSILESSEMNHISVILTNPCFELWLFLHVADINDDDFEKAKLLKNEKVNKNRRFIEKNLSDILGGFNKARYDFFDFLPHIKKAIKQESKLERDIRKMKGKLGSNVGILIEKMTK